MTVTAAPWGSRLAKLPAVRNTGRRIGEHGAQHDQAEDGRQRAHLAPAHARKYARTCSPSGTASGAGERPPG
jgi:hypothetical protein